MRYLRFFWKNGKGANFFVKKRKKVLTKQGDAAIITPVSQTNGFEPNRTAMANGVTVTLTTLTRTF